MKRFLAVLCVMALGGCARLNVQAPLSADRPIVEETRTPDGLKVMAKSSDDMLLDVLRLGYQTCLSKVEDGKVVARPAACTDDQIMAFLNAGLTLSESFCDNFFRNANQSARKRQYARGAFNDGGGAIQAVLGLAKVTTGIVSGIGTANSFIDGTFRNYDTSFMVDADLAKLRRLVLTAQDAMRINMDNVLTDSIYSAERRIIRYSGLCTFLGMKGLLDDSIAAKADAIAAENKDAQPERGDKTNKTDNSKNTDKPVAEEPNRNDAGAVDYTTVMTPAQQKPPIVQTRSLSQPPLSPLAPPN